MIKHLYYNYGIKDILFDDDTFTVFRERLLKICNLLKKENLNISWNCNSRINLVDEEILKIMKNSGCWLINYGIESGSQEVLNNLKKGITLSQVRDTIRLTKKAGIKTKGFFIVGLPCDTKGTIKQTIDFMLELPLDFAEINLFTPFPGSETYETAKKVGWFDNNYNKMTQFKCIYTPPNITVKELKDYQKSAFQKFYLRPRIILDQIKMINSFSNFLKTFKGGFGLLNFLFSNKQNEDG